jgi:hypothetical protein
MFKRKDLKNSLNRTFEWTVQNHISKEDTKLEYLKVLQDALKQFDGHAFYVTLMVCLFENSQKILF